MKKILVVGSSNMDIVLDVNDFPERGETVKANSLNRIPGGKGANQAFACGRLGSNCSFIGRIGDDQNGAEILNSLKSANVDVAGVSICNERPTGMAVIAVNEKGQNTIIIMSGANDYCDRGYIKEKISFMDDVEVVLTQFEIPYGGVEFLLETAKKQGKITILNPAPVPDGFSFASLKYVDYLTPNETELKKMTGMEVETEDEITDAARVLLKEGAKNVVVTMGKRGAMLVNKNITKVFPPFNVKVVDTTAAGDTFSAALAVALSERRDILDAMGFANSAASITVSKYGAQTSIPFRNEVDKLYIMQCEK